MNVLLTGGSGFVGQNLARRLIARGDQVTALVRRSSQRQALEGLGARLAFGDLTTGEGLAEAVEGQELVLHLAGITRARTHEEYHRANADGTRRLMEAVARKDKPARFVYCSSLSAAGPSTAGKPLREADEPAPLSIYGRSKLGGELAVRAYADRVPSVIVRPPIVYGPADRDFLPALLPMAKRGLVLKSGFGPKHYSLVHVDDLCEAILLAAEKGQTISSRDPGAGVYHVSDGREYTWEEVCDALMRALGRPRARVVSVPDALSWVAGFGSELGARVRGTVPMLNLDKARELRAEAWTCAIDRARNEIAFTPAYSLDHGFQNTIAWYRQEGLL